MPKYGCIDLRVRRQDGAHKRERWEDFLIERRDACTVADILKAVERAPRLADGQGTSPVAWESGCGEGRCGSCAMLINGKPLLACRAKLDDFPPAPIILEPLTKFPIVRDLWVDRGAVFEALKAAGVWVEPDCAQDEARADMATADVGPDAARRAYEYGRCIRCGICMEVCPSYSGVAVYVGPAAVAASAAYQELCPARADAQRMQRALMEPGGITGCGAAMNCVKLCPREIPITNAIAITNRRVNAAAWKILRGKKG